MSELPKGWVETTIKDVSIKCSQNKPADEEQLVYVDIGSIDRKTKTILTPQFIKGRDAPSRARKRINKNDILVSLTRPNLNAVAIVPLEFDNQYASTGFDVIKPQLIDSRFIFFIVRSRAFIDAISGVVKGALYPAAKATDVQNYRFLLPPLNEQKRIADKLDTVLAKVDAVHARLDKIPTLLKRFRQSVLAAATSGELTREWRGQDSTSWQHYKLSAIAKSITDGDHQAPPKVDKGVPFLVISNVNKGVVDFSSVTRWVPQSYYDSLKPHRKPNKNDLLYTVTGSFGIPVLVDTDKSFCFQRHIGIIKPNFEIVEVKYLFYLLMSDLAFSQAKRSATGTAQKTVSLKSLRNFVLPFPSLPEQTEIVRRVESLFAHADTVEKQYNAAKARLDKLTQSILAKAFRGELVNQDINDEPAEQLLERIKQSLDSAQQKVKKPRRKSRTKATAATE